MSFSRFYVSVRDAKKKAKVDHPPEEREAQLRAKCFLHFPAGARGEAKSTEVGSASLAFKSRQVIRLITNEPN
jgi:hypothetical protein